MDAAGILKHCDVHRVRGYLCLFVLSLVNFFFVVAHLRDYSGLL